MGKNKKYTITIAAALLLVVVVAILTTTISSDQSEKYYVVEKGRFEALLSCKGEINGLHSTQIKTPKILGDRELRLWSLKISNLTQDGKYVKKGDFILQLDHSRISSSMQTERQNLEREEADLKNAKIDSTVKLTQMREDIINAKLDLEFNKIDLELSVYESAAYQRRAQMKYQKAENNIAKKQRDYTLEQNKLKMKVRRSEEKVDRSKKKMEKFKKAMKAIRITAPKDGIIIFGKGFDGKKYSKDGNVYTYDFAPPIASLPDMSEVISEIFVKEIDIAKVSVDDDVKVTFDALEGVEIPGKIKTIARVGEGHKDFDMKVFKVIILLEQTHSGLKPAMSSNNNIVLANEEDALFVPIKTVYNENGTSYVYTKSGGGFKKQTIETVIENEEFVLVKSGINEGDKVLMSAPLSKTELAQK